MTVKVERVVKGKTISIPLSAPMRIGDEELDVLTLRRPTAGDFRVFDINKGDVDAAIQLTARLSVPPMTPGQVDKMDLEDFQAVQEALKDFLKKPAKPELNPSTS